MCANYLVGFCPEGPKCKFVQYVLGTWLGGKIPSLRRLWPLQGQGQGPEGSELTKPPHPSWAGDLRVSGGWAGDSPGPHGGACTSSRLSLRGCGSLRRVWGQHKE